MARSTEEITVLTVEHGLHLAIAGAIFPVAPLARSIDEPTVRIELILRLAIVGKLFLLPQTQKAREVTLISKRIIIPQTQVRIGSGILAARHKNILSRALAGEDVE
jgi:hypothetical protein